MQQCYVGMQVHVFTDGICNHGICSGMNSKGYGPTNIVIQYWRSFSVKDIYNNMVA